MGNVSFSPCCSCTIISSKNSKQLYSVLLYNCLLFFVKLDKISYTYMDTDENVQWHEAAKITSVFICIQNFLLKLPSYTNEIKLQTNFHFQNMFIFVHIFIRIIYLGLGLMSCSHSIVLRKLGYFVKNEELVLK